MIQHRSGIPNFTNSPNFWAAPTQSYEASLALIMEKPANFKPDDDYEYSNTNYLLINKIMDSVLGYGNFQFIQQSILMPPNLTHTFRPSLPSQLAKVIQSFQTEATFFENG